MAEPKSYIIFGRDLEKNDGLKKNIWIIYKLKRQFVIKGKFKKYI